MCLYYFIKHVSMKDCYPTTHICMYISNSVVLLPLQKIESSLVYYFIHKRYDTFGLVWFGLVGFMAYQPL